MPDVVRTFSTSSRARLRRARPPGPGWALSVGALITEAECVNDRGARPVAAGSGGTLAAGGRQLGPLPLARQRTGAGRCRNAACPGHRPHPAPAVRAWVTAPARAARPSSSRRALCRRARITVKSAPYGRVLRMALRATLECDLPRQDRRLTGGRGGSRWPRYVHVHWSGV